MRGRQEGEIFQDGVDLEGECESNLPVNVSLE
jgi:hypothetical protein